MGNLSMSTNTHTLLCRYACWGYDALVSKANAPEGVMAKPTNDKFRALSVMQMLQDETDDGCTRNAYYALNR